MLKGIGVNNFRSFNEPVFIDLKPITVFVGKNSSGKSSLLRTLPLFRQSTEENKTGPILWYGRYVDFGDFSDAISKNSQNDCIEFTFKIEINEGNFNGQAINSFARRVIVNGFDAEVKIFIHTVGGKKTRTKKIIIRFLDVSYEINIFDNNEASLKISHDNNMIFQDGLIIHSIDRFIPLLMVNEKLFSKKIPEKIMNSNPWGRLISSQRLDASSSARTLKWYIDYKLHNNGEINNLHKINEHSEDFHSYLARSISESFSSSKDKRKNKRENKETIDNVYPYVLSELINDINHVINDTLNSEFNSVRYIAPIRATSERFYRFQDLQVSEIDHTGSNLAMILNSLDSASRSGFEAWVRENFGFSVKAKQVGAHFAVYITTEEGSGEYNISDMGFGYSQVLPIIMAIWLETQKKTKKGKVRNNIIFTIEQPELHLHPSYQYKLALIFAKVIAKSKEMKLNLTIIFETHSQNMIEALGECIEEKTGLSEDDVSILVFEKNDKNQTIVRKSHFDENGYLQDWPVGFFSGR